MKFENTEVFNFEGALRGMRQPMQSHEKSDSHYWLPNEHIEKYEEMCDDDISWEPYYIGENDMALAQRLVVGGSEHAKFMRQIFVSVDVTGPLLWWKEIDQYKVGTVTDSQSTMHKLASTPITLDCFDLTGFNRSLCLMDPVNIDMVSTALVNYLEQMRLKYLKTSDRAYWDELIRWLPESWLQTRTWTANYAVLRTIFFQRKNHRLVQWHQFINWINRLPYAKELITLEKK